MTGRVFHTSDWHLGRQIGRHRRDAEFDAVLAEIVEIAADFRPDLIVHSGDLFDSSRPGLDDIVRAAQTLRRLEQVAPVVVVAGNHDTRNVLTFLEFILNDMGRQDRTQARVRFATDARPDGLLIAEYPAADGESTIRIGALPYLHPNRFAYDFADPATATAAYAERMRAVQADVHQRLTSGARPDHLLVFAAHLFVEGAVPSRSEKPISIADDYAVVAGALPGVVYGALGHIHKPQAITSAPFPAYYAGSPLQLDFGEINDTKSVVLAEIAPGREPRITTEPLTSGRRLVKLEGTLDEIAQRAGRVGDAWVKAVVKAEASNPHLGETLQKMLPEATLVIIDEIRPGAANRVLDRSAAAEELPGVDELLRSYLDDRGTSGVGLDRVMAAFGALCDEPDPEAPSPCCEETLLSAAIAGSGLDGIDRSGLLTAIPSPEGVR
ncbi:metallophosphoesterase family protein [Sinosporangium siamense]|uniref:Nuclease SbcCD subunit D n=1 Tax=Sinosporangium siamense TaxID=1367973 RepID=A0A919RJR5_9ACTN|nr:exonuclease SbcCD subunit D [Sinosporangium siamense]GII95121.1 nuclease SbcCD subunit D [Sinosporangium siamense]